MSDNHANSDPSFLFITLLVADSLSPTALHPRAFWYTLTTVGKYLILVTFDDYPGSLPSICMLL